MEITFRKNYCDWMGQFALQVANSGRKHRLQLFNIFLMLNSSFTDKYTYPWLCKTFIMFCIICYLSLRPEVQIALDGWLSTIQKILYSKCLSMVDKHFEIANKILSLASSRMVYLSDPNSYVIYKKLNKLTSFLYCKMLKIISTVLWPK